MKRPAPNGPPTGNRAFLGAWRKGYAARKAGKPCRSPYEDLRGGKHGNVVTFSRTFIKQWERGWRYADAEMTQ